MSKKCGNVDEVPSSFAEDDVKEDEPKWVDRMIRLLGYASGLVMGAILGKLYVTDNYHE